VYGSAVVTGIFLGALISVPQDDPVIQKIGYTQAPAPDMVSK